MKFKYRNINKGFTLVELLAVIIIMGILTVMAIPGLNYIKIRNTQKKFEKYNEFMVEAAKLYTDSYSEDMFGYNSSGCYMLNLDELYQKKLIKEFNDHGVNCNNSETFVRVEKNGNKYKYVPSIKCTNAKDKSVYEKTTKKCIIDDSKRPNILINVENLNSSNEWSSRKKITILIKSDSGLMNNSFINYGFSTNNEEIPIKPLTYNFNNEFGSTELKYEFIDDNKRNGIFYLYIDGTGLVNSDGYSSLPVWSVKLDYDSIRPSMPTINNKYEDKWFNSESSKIDSYVLQLSSLDSGSGIEYFKYKYPNSENVWHTYEKSNSNNFTTTPFTIDRNETVEIQACDYSSNCSESAFSNIKIDTTLPTVDGKINSEICGECTVDLTAIDDVSGIENWKWKFTDGDFNDWVDNDNNPFTFSMKFTEKGKTISVVVSDKAGNVSLPYDYDLTINSCFSCKKNEILSGDKCIISAVRKCEDVYDCYSHGTFCTPDRCGAYGQNCTHGWCSGGRCCHNKCGTKNVCTYSCPSGYTHSSGSKNTSSMKCSRPADK